MVKERVVLVVHALVGWAVCGMTVALGREVLSMQSTLVLHAVVAPLAFWLLAWRYAVWFPKGSPVEVSPFFVERYESRARANLAEALKELSNEGRQDGPGGE